MKDATGGTFNMPGPCMMCEDALAVTVARSAYHRAPANPLARVGQDPCHRPLRHLGRHIWLTLVAQIWRVRRVCRGVQQPVVSSA